MLVERARLAAKRGDAAMVRDSVSRLEKFVGTWPPEVVERYRALQQTLGAANASDTTRAIAFLRNVLARVPTFRESRQLVTPSAELIAEPFTTFLRLATPVATPSAADTALTFTPEVIGGAPTSLEVRWRLLRSTASSVRSCSPPILNRCIGWNQRRHRRRFRESRRASTSLLALDWNHDFKMDLVAAGPAGVRLFIQSADGAFTDETSRASGAGGPAAVDATGVWAADVEMDGDLDIVVGVRAATTLVLRNNGDGTWRPLQPFPDATGVRAFVWGDIDGDGDPDAASIDESGALQVFANLQAGQFKRFAGPPSRREGLSGSRNRRCQRRRRT